MCHVITQANRIFCLLSRTQKVTNHSFPGATLDDLEDYIQPILRRKPDHIIFHAGTNNLHRDSAKEILSKVDKVVKNIKEKLPEVSVSISSIIKRNDKQELNGKIGQVNNLLLNYCEFNNYGFMNNNNIQDDCLNQRGLHLNPKGIIKLASNIRSYINY